MINDIVSQMRTLIPVGASLLAMGVNDYAYSLDKRVALRFFASKLAPTGALASAQHDIDPGQPLRFDFEVGLGQLVFVQPVLRE